MDDTAANMNYQVSFTISACYFYSDKRLQRWIKAKTRIMLMDYYEMAEYRERLVRESQ